MKNSYVKGSAGAVVLLIVVLFIILAMAGYIYLRSSSHQAPTSSNADSSATPTITVKDFAPSLPMAQKTTILIQLSDSSEEKYIVPKDQVDTYIKSLPEGDHVVSQTK